MIDVCADPAAATAGGLAADDNEGSFELPADHSVSAASFRASVGVAAATFLRAVRSGLSDAQLEAAIRMTLSFAAGGSGGSGAQLVQRRAIVMHVLEAGLIDGSNELSDRSASHWQAWQRGVLTTMCVILRGVVGANSKSGASDDAAALGSKPVEPEFVCDDGLPADAISDCGIVCLLNSIAYVLLAASCLLNVVIHPYAACFTDRWYHVLLNLVAFLWM